MLNQLLNCFVLLLLSSCGGLVHPGIISSPQLNQKGDVQTAFQLLAQDELNGAQGHLAYALTDEWGIAGALGFMSTLQRTDTRNPDAMSYYELSVIRKLGPSATQSFNMLSLQAGYGESHHSVLNRYAQSLRFTQRQLFLQGNSRHKLSDEVAVNFGLRLGGTMVDWMNKPTAAMGFENRDVERTVVYLDFQPVLMTATPIMQIESLFSNISLTLTLQPTYVLNQRFMELPASPLNMGVRWNLKR